MALPLKIVLALVSVVAYWLIITLGERFEWSAEFLGFSLVLHLVGLVFGLLVLAPYAIASPQRIPRMLALAVASAAIYYGAVRFVIDGPFESQWGAPIVWAFVIAGAGAALLCGLAVAALVPRRPSGFLIVLTLAAGAAGGALFEWDLPVEWAPGNLHAYLAWQLLVCLALHRGFLPSSRGAG